VGASCALPPRPKLLRHDVGGGQTCLKCSSSAQRYIDAAVAPIGLGRSGCPKSSRRRPLHRLMTSCDESRRSHNGDGLNRPERPPNIGLALHQRRNATGGQLATSRHNGCAQSPCHEPGPSHSPLVSYHPTADESITPRIGATWRPRCFRHRSAAIAWYRADNRSCADARPAICVHLKKYLRVLDGPPRSSFACHTEREFTVRPIAR
jgi:hypothetical protein